MKEINNNTQNTEKPNIIYVFDPMCGWCYAFSNVMAQIFEEYKQHFNFRVLSGGMMIGEGAVPAHQMADYILQAYQRVEQTSGIKFGEKYLDIFRDGTYILNSELGCKAVTTIKEFAPEITYQFVKDLQNAHFVDGMSLNTSATYDYILNKYNIDLPKFNELLNSEEITAKTYGEFAFVKQLGVRGYPAVLLNHNNKFYSISAGYSHYQNIKEMLDNILENLDNIK